MFSLSIAFQKIVRVWILFHSVQKGFLLLKDFYCWFNVLQDPFPFKDKRGKFCYKEMLPRLQALKEKYPEKKDLSSDCISSDEEFDDLSKST